jgi:hypothetical protein
MVSGQDMATSCEHGARKILPFAGFCAIYPGDPAIRQEG